MHHNNCAANNALSVPPRLPGGYPIVGHLPALLRDPLHFLQSARTTGPLVALRLGTRAAYLVNDHKLLHQILVTDAASYVRGKHFQKARAVAGGGLITASGSNHKRQRTLVLPAFSRASIRRYAEGMTAAVEKSLSTWPDTEPVDARKRFLSLTTTVAGQALFGTQLPASDVALVEEALPILTRGVNLRVLDPTGLVEKLPTPGNRNFRDVMTRLDELIADLVRRRQSDPPAQDDLLSILVRGYDSRTGRTLTDQEVRDEIISILLSSTETTALTLSWACYELARHPEFQEKVQRELDTALPAGPVGHEDLKELKFTQQVVKETLRLYPPTYFLSRETAQGIDLGGYHLPVGSTLLYSLYAQHRDELLFPRAEEFDPYRWDPSRAIDRTIVSAYIPFGEGAHRCVGESFATAEATTALAVLLRSRTLRLAPRAHVQQVGTVTLAPRGLNLIAERRVHSAVSLPQVLQR
jgi:pentalenene oxygenase